MLHLTRLPQLEQELVEDRCPIYRCHQALGAFTQIEVPAEWERMTRLLKSKPGHENFPMVMPKGADVFPVIRCVETIPCNPCSVACPQEAITIPGDGEILPRPEFSGGCTACLRCVSACPGLAITLVDYRCDAPGKVRVTLPFEMPVKFKTGDEVMTIAHRGEDVARARVVEIIDKGAIAPCRAACPADVSAPGYIELIRKGRFGEAIDLLRRDMPLPSVCGRVCYSPCEDECARKDLDEPVAICALKRFVADLAMRSGAEAKPFARVHDERVAVVGSGPAGLACANELSYRGYGVTVFEAREKAGGMLRYGIPAYRLPDDILDWEIGLLEKRGIGIKTYVKIEEIAYLFKKGFKSVFIAAGAQESMKLGITGEDMDGVVGMLEFLRDAKTGVLKRLGGDVAVIGGGNSAMDAARAAIRIGAKCVKVVYRRSRDEMPAHGWEVGDAEAEGVTFEFLTAPVEVMGRDGKAVALRCRRMRLGEPDESGRPRPIPIENSEFDIQADLVISAIGQVAKTDALSGGLSRTGRGTLKADEMTCETGVEGVFAGGDVVSGPATVAEAFGAGKRAAESIDRFLRGVDLGHDRGIKPPVAERNVAGLEKVPRVLEKKVLPNDRRRNFGEITAVLGEEEALREAGRCLGCGLYSECMPGPAIMAKYSVVPGIRRSEDKSVLVTVEAERELATKVAGIRIQSEDITRPIETIMPSIGDDDVVVCRCERVTLGKIRGAIRDGVRDMNQLKAILKAGLGACGGKTCGPLIERVFRREGVPRGDVTTFTERPLVAEVPMGMFAGAKNKGE